MRWGVCGGGALCLPTILQAGFKQPPEAELRTDLSRDCCEITTRWINTRVVKVKWCYVARCYWTRPVEIHDTDTFFPPFHWPLLRAGTPCRDPPGKGQVLESSPTRWTKHPCSRWNGLAAAAPIVSDTIERTISDQEGHSRRPGQC